MPTQSFDTGGYYQVCARCGKRLNWSESCSCGKENYEYSATWIGDDGGRCPKCGKPYLYVGDNSENIVCRCKPLDKMEIKPLPDFWGGFRANEKIYAGVIGGIPIYVNSEKDRVELSEKIKQMLGKEFINLTMQYIEDPEDKGEE